LASIAPCQDGSGKHHLRLVKVELLIFGSALPFVGSGYGLHWVSQLSAAASTSWDLSSIIGFPL
jgi:hypothetical protein